MLKDHKMQIAVLLLLFSFLVWTLLVIDGIASSDRYAEFVAVTCATAFSLVLAFIKPDTDAQVAPEKKPEETP